MSKLTPKYMEYLYKTENKTIRFSVHPPIKSCRLVIQLNCKLNFLPIYWESTLKFYALKCRRIKEIKNAERRKVLTCCICIQSITAVLCFSSGIPTLETTLTKCLRPHNVKWESLVFPFHLYYPRSDHTVWMFDPQKGGSEERDQPYYHA